MKVKIFLSVLLLMMIITAAACANEKENNKDSFSQTETAAPIIDSGTESSGIEMDVNLEGGKYKNVIYNKDGIRVIFGAVGGLNLFEPDSQIGFFAQVTGESLNGTEARVTFTSISLRINEEKSFTMKQPDGGTHTYTGSFSAKLNGVYTLTLVLEGDVRLSFNVGVVPKNKIASNQFYFGVHILF